jgi:hypothetical protein
MLGTLSGKHVVGVHNAQYTVTVHSSALAAAWMVAAPSATCRRRSRAVCGDCSAGKEAAAVSPPGASAVPLCSVEGKSVSVQRDKR